ncbi:jg2126 [Pararge aegeria aegeria]|uniref:Jg2126 protein n=1 Tax=Pararge aegeria aegeria TaxID=348720 RepID=A0A8S4RS55_9NEOP|nr:jg2126 [Pararge aegeria aegeria]
MFVAFPQISKLWFQACEHADYIIFVSSSFIFVPFGVETLGPRGPEARDLFKELSQRVIESSGDPRAEVTLANELVWPSKGAMLPAF